MCNIDYPEPVPCNKPCKYTQWSDWGQWNTASNEYHSNKPRCRGNGAESEQTIIDRAFGSEFRNSYPQSVSYNNWDTSNTCKRAFLDGRNDYGDYFDDERKAHHSYRDNNQCFRVFETKQSFQQVEAVITKAKAVIDANWNIDWINNDWFSNDVWYSFTIIKSWLLDGLYMDRNHDQTVVTIRNIDNVLEHFGWIQDWYRGRTSLFNTNTIWDVNLGNRDCWVDYDILSCMDTIWPNGARSIIWSDFLNLRYALDWDNVNLVNRGDQLPRYNFDGQEKRAADGTTRYEYIHGWALGQPDQRKLRGSEGWPLDILKRWMDKTTPAKPVDGFNAEPVGPSGIAMNVNNPFKPHGWRFSCRDRRDTQTQGYMARWRNPDCKNNPDADCCGLVDIHKCELPICPDWTEWAAWGTCSKECIEDQVLGLDTGNYGYRARGRSCEADHQLMDDENTAHYNVDANGDQPQQRRVLIQLPEQAYTGCNANTDIRCGFYHL